MASRNNINIKIQVQDKASKEIKSVGISIENTADKADRSVSKMSGFASSLGNVFQIASGIVAAQVFTRISDGISGFISNAITATGELEQVEIAFTTMLGSAEKSQSLIADIREAAVATPFELNELNAASKSLLAFGVEAENIVPTLVRLGDVSSGIGSNVGDIAEIYGKARVQGRLFAEDINQLTGRGIPIIAELAEQFGVAESQVRELVEDGEIGFKNLEEAFKSMTGEGGQFAGLMEAQSKSLEGIKSNISDTLTNMSVDIAKNTGLFDIIKNGAEGFLGILERLAPIGEMVINKVIGGIKNIAQEAAPFVQELKDEVIQLVDKMQENGFLERIKEIGKSLAKSFSNTIKNIIITVLDKVIEFVEFLQTPEGQEQLDAFIGMMEDFARVISEAAGFAGRLMEFFRAINTFGTGSNQGQNISQLIGGLQPNVGRGRADGGVVQSGSPYVIGERGPEMFIPNASGVVVPNETVNNITMNLNGTQSNPMAAIQLLTHQINLNGQ